MSENKNTRLIIIPTYNEAGVISALIEKIFKIYPHTDILVVDDNSPDGTGDIIDDSAQKDIRIHCLHRQKKEGIGPAYIEGFTWAVKNNFDYIMQMDADFSHNPEYVPELFKLAENYDVVIGSRYVKAGDIENWGIIRRIVSRFGSLYAKILLRIPVNDLTGGFKCFKKHVLENLINSNILSRGYAFQIETTFKAYKCGAKIKEFPIIFTDRRVGETKMSFDVFFEAIFAVVKLMFIK